MKRLILAAAAIAVTATAAQAQNLTPVAVAMSGWTGFAPLTLAKEAGIFKKNGLDVTIKKIPQKDRHLAIASGDVQCAATTVETWVAWNAAGVATTQIFQLDKSYGADGMVVKPGVAKIADLKGKTVAASAPGTAPYFTLAWMLKKNGLSVKDVKVVNQAIANLTGVLKLDKGATPEQPRVGKTASKAILPVAIEVSLGTALLAWAVLSLPHSLEGTIVERKDDVLRFVADSQKPDERLGHCAGCVILI